MSDTSEWFKKFSAGDPEYADFYMNFKEEDIPSKADLSKVVRPRTTDLLVKYELGIGTRYIWRTFLNDQVDLNYENPTVLLKMLDALLFHVSNGCSLIRLDAVGFLWKRIGTNCLHLPETHCVVKLIRELFSEVAPHVLIITETNVPHAENISYFGNGKDEAHMVYNFTLAPLTAFSLITQDATKISEWAMSLDKPSEEVTYFNFLDSHDGLGLRPVEGILNDQEVQMMVEKALSNKGLVNYMSKSDGGKKAYEINTTWWSLLYDENDKKETNIDRYIASRAIALSFAGIPGVYLHGLLGSANDTDGVEKTEHNRDISRRDLIFDRLEEDILSGTKTSKIFARFSHLLKIRSTQKAFHPNAKQTVLNLDRRIFALERGISDDKIVVLINISKEHVLADMPFQGIDIISGEQIGERFNMKPYQIVWMKRIANNSEKKTAIEELDEITQRY